MKYGLVLVMAAMSLFAQGQIEPRAGAWKTWILSSGRELRLPPPGDAAATADEISWLKDFMSEAGNTAHGKVAFWDTGSPGMRWLELVQERILDGRIALPMAIRPLTLLNVAIYDATVAAWDSKYAYNRPRPSERDRTIVPTLNVPNSPSYPSEHAVAAGAAEAVLSFLYPSEAALFHELAEEAGRSRLYAGVHYPSDVLAGLELGRAVGRKVVEHAATDGFTTPWTGTVPTGPGMWVGTNPFFANAQGWKPFVLSRPSELRPGPPPAHTSAETLAELAELKQGPQPFLNQAKALFWQTPEGNFTWFFDQVTKRLFEYRLDGNAPRSARAYALMAVTTWDMFLAGHDAKMTYWRIRPSQLDSSVPLLFPPPNHPSYPANHGMSLVRANLLGYLFPSESDHYQRLGEEMGMSRIWAGIHYRSDITTAWDMARQLLDKIIERAESDGSRQ